MADQTFYSWTNFNVSNADDPLNPRAAKRIVPGDVVTAADLDVDDDNWNYLVENGAVRAYPYPDMGTFSGSPVEFAKARLAAMSEGGYFDTQYGAVGTDTPPEIDPETGKAIPPGTNAAGPAGAATPAKNDNT